MKLPSKADIAKALTNIQSRREILENQVNGVVKNFCPALFVWGPPGLGKSWTLTSILDAIAWKQWVHHTAYATPKALVLALAERPDSVHLFEDCERMLRTDLSASVLRAACGAPAERERWVTWETANEKLRVKFTGGVIIATNANLARLNGPMQGVASRFRPVQWTMSLHERICVILHMAESNHTKGGVRITPKEARKVAVRLVEMLGEERGDIELDIRLYAEHALPAYAQSIMNPAVKWEDQLLAKLTGTAQTAEESQAARTRRLQQLAQQIDMGGGKTADKIAKWKELTELGQAIYYRHLKAGKGGK